MNQIANKPANKDELIVQLHKMQGEIQKAIPKHLTAERVMRLAQTAYQKTPKLQQANIRSILGCVMEASQMGLEFNGVGGHAYLIPYEIVDKTDKNPDPKKRKKFVICQLIIGYRGMIDIAMRSGRFMDIDADVVYEKDVFEERKGSNKKLTHNPSRLANRGKIIGAYAIARMVNGGEVWRFLSVEDLNKIKSSSRSGSGSDSPWIKWYNEMAIKSAIRRLFKILPCSPEMNRVLESDNDDDAKTRPPNLADNFNLPAIEGDFEYPPEFEQDDEDLDGEDSQEESNPKNLDELADQKEKERDGDQASQNQNTGKKPAAEHAKNAGKQKPTNESGKKPEDPTPTPNPLMEEYKAKITAAPKVADVELIFNDIMQDRTKKRINQPEFQELDNACQARTQKLQDDAEAPPPE